MQPTRTTVGLLASLLLLVSLNSDLIQCQLQLGEAVGSLLNGLRGTLESLLGGGRRFGSSQAGLTQDYANQFMQNYGCYLSPQPGGYQASGWPPPVQQSRRPPHPHGGPPGQRDSSHYYSNEYPSYQMLDQYNRGPPPQYRQQIAANQ